MLDMPSGAVWLLDFIGIKYQMLFVDADQIDDFADAVRGFARRVAETNDEGTKIVSDLADSWEGRSYRALVARWTKVNSTNMTELQEVCELVAGALEAAAVTVRVVQAAVVAELAALAATFVATQIAGIVTMGAASPLGLAVAAAARRLVSEMEQVLVAYLLFEVLERAIEPFEEAIGRMVNNFAYGAVADYLGVKKFHMEPAMLERAANKFKHLGEQMKGHGEWLNSQLEVMFPDDGSDFDDGSSRGLIVPPGTELPGGVVDPTPTRAEGRTPAWFETPRLAAGPSWEADDPGFGTAQDNTFEPQLAGFENSQNAGSPEPAPALSAQPATQTPHAATGDDDDAESSAARDSQQPGLGYRADDPEATTAAPGSADTPWLRVDSGSPEVVSLPSSQDDAATAAHPTGAAAAAPSTGTEQGPARGGGRGRTATPLHPRGRKRKEGNIRTPLATPWTGRPPRSVAAQDGPDRIGAPGAVGTRWNGIAVGPERKADTAHAASAVKANADKSSARRDTRTGKSARKSKRSDPAATTGEPPPGAVAAPADVSPPPVDVKPPKR